MGLKDVSMIETPPKNRYPVQTYLVARNDALIKEAIEREIARGGQVFYLYNRVESMPQQYHKLQNLIPQARIGVAHGKMKRNELEEVLSQFIDHEYDVLVSTTIIETGIDIPNSNTLIIHEADKLGLAQLYQIRGRVGRSDKIAYAYLFYDTIDMLSEEAKKRLTAIQDFTALGSGYKIALRDLAIRGAGDILGQEQSGFIDTVGYDLYMKLLEETMTGQKAFKDIPVQDNEVFAPRHVDPQYVDHDTLRIEIHKRIASIHSMRDAELLKQELTDRFGPVHPELQLYMYEKLFKKLSYELGIQKTEPLKKVVKFVLSQETTEHKNNALFFQKGRNFKVPVDMYFEHGHLIIEMTYHDQKAHWLYLACALLEWLKEAN
jgi:transcription-repair coupling factor (superfamily II helicase)